MALSEARTRTPLEVISPGERGQFDSLDPTNQGLVFGMALRAREAAMILRNSRAEQLPAKPGVVIPRDLVIFSGCEAQQLLEEAGFPQTAREVFPSSLVPEGFTYKPGKAE